MQIPLPHTCPMTHAGAVPQVSLTAVHCAKTLIVAASTGNLMLRHCTKMLLPGLVEYVARIATALADGGATDKDIAGASEVIKAFAAFFAVVPPDQRELLPEMR